MELEELIAGIYLYAFDAIRYKADRIIAVFPRCPFGDRGIHMLALINLYIIRLLSL